MQAVKLDAKKLAGKISIKVEIKNYYQWRTRLWLAEKLIRLGCWIAWLNCEFVSSGEKLTPETMAYRRMILELLNYSDRPIPQETRDKAYSLLDEYYKQGECG